MRRSRTSVSGRPWLARRATRVGSTGLVGLIVVVSMLLGPAAGGAWLQATPMHRRKRHRSLTVLTFPPSSSHPTACGRIWSPSIPTRA